MQEGMLMTGTFGWTIKVDWKNQTRGMNHKKARRIQEMADLKMKDVKQTKKKRSRWGIKISPLKPLIGRGARSIDHHFNNSPTVKRVKQHIETPKERKQRFEKLRKKPRQHIDDESRASNHDQYHKKRMSNNMRGNAIIKFLKDGRDDTIFLHNALALHFVNVSKEEELTTTVLEGPLRNVEALLELIQTKLLPLSRSHRIVSDDFEILSRYFPKPVQILNTRTITPLHTRKSHCDAFTPCLKVSSTLVDGAHGKTDTIMYPDVNQTTGKIAANTIVIQTTTKKPQKQKRQRTLLKKMNKKNPNKNVVDDLKHGLIKHEQLLQLRYGRGASTSPIVPGLRRQPAQSYSNSSRCTYQGIALVKHSHKWGYNNLNE